MGRKRKPQTPKGRAFEGELRKYMCLRHMDSLEDVRELTTIGKGTSTMGNYMADPEIIPIGKVGEIMQAVRMPKEDRIRMLLLLADGDS